MKKSSILDVASILDPPMEMIDDKIQIAKLFNPLVSGVH